ncbi:MAG: acylphosphatase [Streptococcaceae bacterium]|jgi:acylphosphatase|nr:acylphosphatase [Streptococcaceae bacterium]
MKKLSINITGRVQGVGFRYCTKILADESGICGGVWNCDDGSVSVEAIGDNEKMAIFLERLKKSPSRFAKVVQMQIQANPEIKEIDKFEIRN